MFYADTVKSLRIFDNAQYIMCASVSYKIVCVRNSDKDGKHFKITEMQKDDCLARLFHTELRES